MICKDCRDAATINRPEMHCNTPGCTCQHRTDLSDDRTKWLDPDYIRDPKPSIDLESLYRVPEKGVRVVTDAA